MDDFVKGLLIQFAEAVTRSADAQGTSNVPVAKWVSLVTGIIIGQQERLDELEKLLADNGITRS